MTDQVDPGNVTNTHIWRALNRIAEENSGRDKLLARLEVMLETVLASLKDQSESSRIVLERIEAETRARIELGHRIDTVLRQASENAARIGVLEEKIEDHHDWARDRHNEMKKMRDDLDEVEGAMGGLSQQTGVLEGAIAAMANMKESYDKRVKRRGEYWTATVTAFITTPVVQVIVLAATIGFLILTNHLKLK